MNMKKIILILFAILGITFHSFSQDRLLFDNNENGIFKYDIQVWSRTIEDDFQFYSIRIQCNPEIIINVNTIDEAMEICQTDRIAVTTEDTKAIVQTITQVKPEWQQYS